MKRIAQMYSLTREQLYRDLELEFRKDLPRWKAQLDPDLTIRFEEPDVLFKAMEAEIRPPFARVLDDFFPRYARILAGEKYRDAVDEIRIEGHTSSEWVNGTRGDLAYFHNMELSQRRTRSTLQYVLLLPQSVSQKSWLVSRLTANGLSSSKPRLNADGIENREMSRRVEFRVRTNADARLSDILKAAQK